MAKKCPYCGFYTEENVADCEKCGARMETVPDEPPVLGNEEWFEDDFDEPAMNANRTPGRGGRRYTPAEGNTVLILGIAGFCTGIFCFGMILDFIAMILGFRWYCEDHSRKKCLVGAILGAAGMLLSILVFMSAAYSQ